MKEIKFLLSNHEVETMRSAFNNAFLQRPDTEVTDNEIDNTDSDIARFIIGNYVRFYEAMKSNKGVTMMDRRVDMALFSANNGINYQLEIQKAAIQIIRTAIEATRKAYKLQSKQSLDEDEGVEVFTSADIAEICKLLDSSESEIKSVISKLEEAKKMMPDFDRSLKHETSK